MRLSAQLVQDISALAHEACSASITRTLSASSRHRAREMFAAISPHLEQCGADPIDMGWRFSNGSRIVIVAQG